jgi:exodeoxyribonuclease VII large subunit
MLLKGKLEAEGLFDLDRKRPLPEWPKRIGVVTSPTGAALQDILNVLRARYPLVQVVLAPAQVQGAEAPATIIRALNALNQRDGLDLIIVARGGGSLEDLWAFNDEGVAWAVAASQVPVISGVGHETDFTICDFCADVRAPTPTAAATVAVPDGAAIKLRLQEKPQLLSALAGQALSTWRDALEREARALASHHPRRRLAELRQRIDIFRRQMETRSGTQIAGQRQLLASTLLRLQALDTRHVLNRGFALVQDTRTEEPITQIRQLSVGDMLTIILADGRVLAQTEQVISGSKSK